MGVTGNYGPGTPLEIIVARIRNIARCMEGRPLWRKGCRR